MQWAVLPNLIQENPTEYHDVGSLQLLKGFIRHTIRCLRIRKLKYSIYQQRLAYLNDSKTKVEDSSREINLTTEPCQQ